MSEHFIPVANNFNLVLDSNLVSTTTTNIKAELLQCMYLFMSMMQLSLGLYLSSCLSINHMFAIKSNWHGRVFDIALLISNV